MAVNNMFLYTIADYLDILGVCTCQIVVWMSLEQLAVLMLLVSVVAISNCSASNGRHTAKRLKAGGRGDNAKNTTFSNVA